MLKTPDDSHFMKMALKEAQAALEADEVPVGAVITSNGQIIARGYNLSERLNDFTAHAEMQAFTSASEFLGGKHLDKCTLFVTLEPCLMCAGAAFNTRISRVVFGAFDDKRGFTKFQNQLDGDTNILHPKTKWQGGLMEEECSIILQEFFRKKREA